MDKPFLCFLTIHAFDRQTDRQTDKRTPFSSLARAGIPCSAVKIGVLQRGGRASAKFSPTRGRPPQIISKRIDRPMNALQFCR